MNYCLEVWGKCTKNVFSRIEKLQKRAIRIIDSSSWRAPSKPIFDKLKIMTIDKIYMYKIGILMYKYDKSILPPIYDNFFKKTSQIHSYNTQQFFYVPMILNPKRQSTVRYRGPIIGNHIFKKLDMACKSWALLTFKSHLRNYLLKNDISL